MKENDPCIPGTVELKKDAITEINCRFFDRKYDTDVDTKTYKIRIATGAHEYKTQNERRIYLYI
jgi:hypothetical protein